MLSVPGPSTYQKASTCGSWPTWRLTKKGRLGSWLPCLGDSSWRVWFWPALAWRTPVSSKNFGNWSVCLPLLAGLWSWEPCTSLSAFCLLLCLCAISGGLTCHWDLSDRPRLANQHAQMRCTPPSITSFIWQFGNHFILTDSCLGWSNMSKREKNVQVNLSNRWAPLQVCPILSQCTELSLSWWHVNYCGAVFKSEMENREALYKWQMQMAAQTEWWSGITLRKG